MIDQGNRDRAFVHAPVDPATGSSAGAPRQTSHRRADIQGLRAVAVLLVVAYHADLPVTGGFVGVDVFFVISGFVITAMLERQVRRDGRIGFGDFYTRRARRLMPALALTSIVVAVAAMFLASPLGPQQATARTGSAASVFGANLQLAAGGGQGYFDLSAEANALLHTWSLSVEEQFYLLFPAALLLVWRLAARTGRAHRRTTFALLAVGTVASLGLSVATTFHPSYRLGTTFAFYSVASRAWEFGIGALLALTATRLARLPTRVAVGAGLVGLALLAIAATTFDASTRFPGTAALVPVLGTALLLAAGGATGHGVSAILATRPAVWIGDRSYGWYLWHWPAIVFASAWWPDRPGLVTAAAVGSLAPAVASYRFVEQPIRLDDRVRGRRVALLAVACVVGPLLAFQGLLAVARAEARTDAVRGLAFATRVHADRQRGCDRPEPIAERTGTNCTWSVAGSTGTIFLVGDSNAGQFTEPVTAAGNAEGHDVEVATSAGCPYVDLIRVPAPGTAFDGERCHRSVLASIDALIARRPSLVILAASGTEYVNGADEALRDPRTGAVGRTPAAKAALWERGLRTVLARLGRHGIPTLVVHTIPQFGTTLGDAWSAQTCPALRIRSGSCGHQRSRAGVRAEQRRTRQAEERASASVPSSDTVDLADDLCSATTCRTERDTVLIYRDASHLSIAGSNGLTARFRRLVERSARS